jgi:small subunit ribosomal protein S6
LQTQVYEGLFIFDSNKFARNQTGLPGEVEKMITDVGGEVLVSRLWEERRLAYPIAGQRKGTYWLLYFRGKTSEIGPLNRKCEIHDGILRQLVLKIHPSLVEPILEHAAGVPETPEVEEQQDVAEEPSVDEATASQEVGEPVGAAE